jgi:hypothetical protein
MQISGHDEVPMELKSYPHVSLSTIVACAKCGVENKVHELMKEVEGRYFHLHCVSDSDTKKAAETVKVHELFIEDDLSVKSEGR